MTDVKIPIYGGISYLPIELEGVADANNNVQVTTLKLGNVSLPVNSRITIPSLAFAQPSEGNERRLVNGNTPFDQTFEFPARNLNLDRQFLTVSWNLLRLRIRIPGGGAPFEIHLDGINLQVSSSMLPGVSLQADLRLVFDANGLNVEESYLKRYEPDVNHLVPMDFKAFGTSDQHFALRWTERNLNYWLQSLTGNFSEESAQIDRDVSLRIVFGDPVQEIRLDWDVPIARTFVFPGLKVTTPSSARFSLVLRSENGQSIPSTLRLILTLAGNQTLSASSNFAWLREFDRELQNDADREADSPSLFSLEFVSKSDVSLVLLELDRSESNLPKFFRQLQGTLPVVDFSTATVPPLSIESLKSSLWNLVPKFDSSLFQLPFLKNDGFNQFIDINFRENPKLDIENKLVTLVFDATIGTGDLSFQTEFSANFNWETFAIDIDHDKGIDLITKTEVIQSSTQYLGLSWRFIGEKLPDQDKYHHFTLVTKDFNYQIQQASGAVIEIDYTQASRADEPITFSIRDFAIAETGISLTAEITDRPARLNGIDTRFRFHGSQLVIKDNQINDFTLSGSGPLPPALVGEAIADISLQFTQENNGLKLVAGSASLQGEKLLSCEGTRFQFSIDGLGLKFVNDDRFHLYFTLTGSAQFNPLDTDDPNGALALLGAIKIDLVECPLTGDASVIAKHVQFLIELPQPLSFSFLGCFEMELRGIGFIPAFEGFDDQPAMELSGQIKFVQGVGDVNTVQIDFHNLYIGLPAPGQFLPRLHLKELGLNISLGEAFSLEGVVEFRDELNEQGFLGEGKLEIPGMPVIAASFAFLRVRRDEDAPWVRAWFIFLEARQISFYIPYVELYIREIGLGFGYRYTIASIRAADEAENLRDLIGQLRELSRTQGDLSKRDRWAVDLEAAGEDPRWTIVFRAMISQTSASPGSISLRWNEPVEQFLPCLFLFDAVVAFRSDLTFFMAVRAWLNTNYYGFVEDVDGLRERPLFTGFVLLSVRQKRFLAQVASNPDGSLGNLPPLPEFVEQAVRNGQFSATFLIEPGLVHAELGWPNLLRWGQKIGPLDAEISGGMIFRVTKHYLVLGISYKARASLSFDAELDLKIVGVRISAFASVAYGARLIGLIDFDNPRDKSALHAGIGLEMRIKVTIALWIRLLFFKKTFRFSLEIGFTAGLEVGFDGLTNPGLRGSGTLFIEAMGRRLQVSVKLGFNEGAVQNALDRTAPFLNVGLEATDVDRSIPGVAATQESRRLRSLARRGLVSRSVTRTVSVAATGEVVSMEVVAERVVATELRALAVGTFHAPHYDLFVIRRPDDDRWGYFVLLPRAEATDDVISFEELGFLPVPPAVDTIESDFVLKIPANSLPTNFELQQFQPVTGQWITPDDSSSIAWNVKWDAVLERGTQFKEDGTIEQENIEVTLQEYLKFAFKLDENENPIADPDPIADREETFADERVHNPSEDAYEAAVRGAVEQFRSSPFFKRDPNSEYERILNDAFQNTTTIYTTSGQTSDLQSSGQLNEEQGNQQAHQLRGMIVQDLIADVREYADLASRSAAGTNAPKPDFVVGESIAFQMGLVFRFRITDEDASITQLPEWLNTVVADRNTDPTNPDHAPTLSQRMGSTSTAPGTAPADFRDVRTFNTAQADFTLNPPQFQRVQPLTDSNTIAIAWDLVWERPPEATASLCQRQPEHHLVHYQVRRRTLDGSEPETVYTIKNGAAAHFEAEFEITDQTIGALSRLGFAAPVLTQLGTLQGRVFQGSLAFLRTVQEAIDTPITNVLRTALLRQALVPGNGLLKSLQPRFQLVDHFTDETLDDQAALPATGRRYLYTITPADFAGNLGRPLTLLATRYPSEPPRVPVDGQFVVRYRLTNQDLVPIADPTPTIPPLVTPTKIEVTWREPIALRQGPQVPVAKHCLIFRKDATLPIGSYGMDSTTQRSRQKSLPTSNARPLPTDIRIELTEIRTDVDDRGVPRQIAQISLDTLKQKGVFPINNQWQPESWRIFFQTISVNEVPSPLAPVQLLLHVESEVGRGNEERQPAELEWLPKPLQLPMLPPEDQRAVTGDSHFPMPIVINDRAPTFTGDVLNDDGTFQAVRYAQHPAGIRLVRFRWNQAPSQTSSQASNQQPEYPIDLNAGYHLLELDVDAFTDETFDDPARLAKALQQIQDVQMLPADDLFLTPTDTLTTNLWEAWYPSTILRRKPPEQRAEGSEIAQTPWYSWHESYLKFPKWDGLTERTPVGDRQALHPFLQTILDTLDENITERRLNDEELPTFNVGVQFGSPMQPGDFTAFRQVTAAKADPYGWGILQRLGLSVAITLRDEITSELITGSDLIITLQNLLEVLRSDTQFADLYQHLHVELLFQPSQSVSPESGTITANSLLAIVQLSLRPIVVPYLKYSRVQLKGTSGKQVTVQFELSDFCSVINQSDPASGQIELQPDTKPLQRLITLSLTGETSLLIRSRILPKVAIVRQGEQNPRPLTIVDVIQDGDVIVIRLDNPDQNPQFQTLSELPVTDERSAYFTIPSTLVDDFSDPNTPLGEQWQFFFKRYLESINSTDPAVPRITIPVTKEGIENLPIAEFINWSQRFFDHGEDVGLDGPWLVTAYPRASTPAYATPDLSGRLRYDHLIESRWAHNYRYYIRPYSRYDLLWRSLLQSPSLFPRQRTTANIATNTTPQVQDSTVTQLANFVISQQSIDQLESKLPANMVDALRSLRNRVFAGRQRFLQAVQGAIGATNTQTFESIITECTEKFMEVLPNPQAGGLDVVLDRTRPVDKPLILNSARLDEASIPGNPAVPGTTWEVIIAQHTEQNLMERNQTLMRRLAFRQVAFTLMRRFAYPEWIDQLKQASSRSHEIPLQFVENQIPEIPTVYPDQPEHVDLSQPLDGAIVRSLDLPQRIGNFQQGALVLQWEALPFYYEHRLLTIAQTSSVVSPLNETIQRDFEYRAPNPIAIAESQQSLWQPIEPFSGSPIALRTRRLQIPLRRFWDALPLAAQAQWSSENPDTISGNDRKLSSLPDPDVVYQIVEVFSGNVEVQAEFYFEPLTKKYQLRQLGQHFLAELIALNPPATLQADYILDTTLQQISDVSLIRNYQGKVLGDTRFKVAFRDNILSTVSVFRRNDRDNILLGSIDDIPIRNQLRALLQNGLTETALQSLIPIPQERQAFFQDFLALDRLYQSWFSQELIAFPPNFNLPPSTLSNSEALQNLLNTVPPEVSELQELVDFIEPEKHLLTWTGSLSPDEETALTTLAAAFASDASSGDQAFADALLRLADRATNASATDVTIEPLFLGLERVPDSVIRSDAGQIRFSINDTASRYTGLIWTGLLFDEQVTVMKQWVYLPTFIAAVDQLVTQLDQIVITKSLPTPRPLQDELPDNIRNQLQIETNRLIWAKPDPTLDQRSALQGLDGDAEFRDAQNRLLQAIDTNPSVPLNPAVFRPSADIPDGIRSQLQIGANTLTWQKPDPTPEQRTDLSTLNTQIQAFLIALRNLRTQIDLAIAQNRNETIRVDLPPNAIRPRPEDLLPSLQSQLQIQGNQLVWTNPLPTPAQRNEIDRFHDNVVAFPLALNRLLTLIDTNYSIPMQPIVDRPRQRNLPELLRDQLTLQPDNQPNAVRWTGRLHTLTQLQALRTLQGDPPFIGAIREIITELTTQTDTIAFDLPVRPQTPGLPETPGNQLPALLQTKLLIGRIILRYHGLMTVAEGGALQGLFNSEPNQNAIARLFNTSVNRGLQASQLKIRSRRGSATPSDLRNLTPQSL